MFIICCDALIRILYKKKCILKNNILRATKELLPPAYSVKERGKMMIKGKGEMVTYWVESKANRVPPTKDEV